MHRRGFLGFLGALVSSLAVFGAAPVAAVGHGALRAKIREHLRLRTQGVEERALEAVLRGLEGGERLGFEPHLDALIDDAVGDELWRAGDQVSLKNVRAYVEKTVPGGPVRPLTACGRVRDNENGWPAGYIWTRGDILAGDRGENGIVPDELFHRFPLDALIEG